MVIYNLACEQGHRFEGWFQDLPAYHAQHGAGQLRCPSCGSAQVEKRVTGSAVKRSPPSLGPPVLAQQREEPAAQETHPTAVAPHNAGARAADVALPSPAKLREVLVTLAAALRSQSEDVGPRFAQEARKIHLGNAPERMICGTTTHAEEADLRAEQVPFLKLPVFDADD